MCLGHVYAMHNDSASGEPNRGRFERVGLQPGGVLLREGWGDNGGCGAFGADDDLAHAQHAVDIFDRPGPGAVEKSLDLRGLHAPGDVPDDPVLHCVC